MPLTDLIPAAQLDAMLSHIRNFAAGFGVDMTSPGHVPNTRRALAIVEYAREQGRLEAFWDAAMTGFWRDGLDIEDDSGLRTIATTAGLDPDAAIAAADDPEFLERVNRLRAEASSQGVTGIPTFLIGDERIVGCQPYDVIAEAVRRAGGSER